MQAGPIGRPQPPVPTTITLTLTIVGHGEWLRKGGGAKAWREIDMRGVTNEDRFLPRERLASLVKLWRESVEDYLEVRSV